MLALLSGPSGLLPLGLLALLAAGAWRFMDRRAARMGACVRTIRLTHQHALHVVDLDGRRLVVGTGPASPPRLVDAGATPALEVEITAEVPSEDAWTRS